MFVHPCRKFLLISFNILSQSRGKFFTLAGAGFGVLESLGEIADDFLERFLLGQSDGLGGFQRLHVVGDDLVLLGELHDSRLVVGKTIVGALGLNLEGRQLLGHLVVFLVRVLAGLRSLGEFFLSQKNSLFGGVEGLLFARALSLQSGHLKLGLADKLLVLGKIFVGLVEIPRG